MAKFCMNCGRELREEDKFCGVCGEGCTASKGSINDIPEIKKDKNAKKKRSTKLWKVILAIAIGVFAFIFVLSMFESGDTRDYNRNKVIDIVKAQKGDGMVYQYTVEDFCIDYNKLLEEKYSMIIEPDDYAQLMIEGLKELGDTNSIEQMTKRNMILNDSLVVADNQNDSNPNYTRYVYMNGYQVLGERLEINLFVENETQRIVSIALILDDLEEGRTIYKDVTGRTVNDKEEFITNIVKLIYKDFKSGTVEKLKNCAFKVGFSYIYDNSTIYELEEYTNRIRFQICPITIENYRKKYENNDKLPKEANAAKS